MSTLHNYPYDLIFFDLDGTLIETAPEIADAVNDTLVRFNLEPVTQQQVNDWIGHGTRELLIQALSERTGLDRAAVRVTETFQLIEAEFCKYYLERCGTRSYLYPNVRHTLDDLKKKGVRLVIVTNKESRYTEVVIRAHQLDTLFDRVISGDTLEVKKPQPLAIQECLLRYGIASDKALFVGDSSIDVATARNANIAVWAVPYGYNMGQPIESCMPDRVIPDISSLLTA
jgi:phosphoglycolate phosphatase